MKKNSELFFIYNDEKNNGGICLFLNKDKDIINDVKYIKVKKRINEYQKFIKKNFEYVGENFAYEARSLHYKDKKKGKGIYGTTTKEDLNELKEEGIKAEILPWIKDTTN